MGSGQHEELRQERRQGLLFVRLRRWLGGAIIFVVAVCLLTLVLDLWNMQLPLVSDLGHWIFRQVGLR